MCVVPMLIYVRNIKKFYEELKDIAPTTGPIYQNDMTSYLSEQNRQDYLMTLERRIIE